MDRTVSIAAVRHPYGVSARKMKTKPAMKKKKTYSTLLRSVSRNVVLINSFGIIKLTEVRGGDVRNKKQLLTAQRH
jgi:hypothetical protein